MIHQGYAFTIPSSSLTSTCNNNLSRSQSILKATTAKEGSIEVPRQDGSTYKLAYRIVRPMNLSSMQAAPIVALHGGPSVPSNYLYPLADIVPYRSIVYYDQLGCGKSDQPTDITQYSTKDSVNDLKILLKKLGVRRFHLYGQSYGGILAYEYMKSIATESKDDDNDEVKCLSAILSGAPTNVPQIEKDFVKLVEDLTNGKDDVSEEEVNELFRVTHQCRLEEMPKILAEAYENAGTVWRGTEAISDYIAKPPPEDASRMPSTLVMRGEYDFVSDEQIQSWKDILNTPFVRYKTLEGCSHHAMLEKEEMYGEIVDSYFGEYD